METRTKTREGPWVPQETFASRLVRLRRELGWNQGEAAIDDGSWSNWERGVNPRRMAEVVDAIHRATGVDRDWLMWGAPSVGDAKGAEVISAGQIAA